MLETTPESNNLSSPEHISQQEQIDTFRRVANEFCDAYFPVTNSKDFGEQSHYIAELRTKLDKASIDRSIITEEIYVETINTAKKQSLGIPESTFLSEKAFDKVIKKSHQYQFIFTKLESLQSEQADKVLKMVGDPKDKLLREYYAKLNLLIAYKEGSIVGFTGYSQRNEFIHIHYQGAQISEFGLGLSMLKKIIDQAHEQGDVKEIETRTGRIPLGLGNLGFQFVDFMGGEHTAFYRLNFEDK